MSDADRATARTNLPPPSDLRLMEDRAQLDRQPLPAWITAHIVISQSLDKQMVYRVFVIFFFVGLEILFFHQGTACNQL